MRNNFKHSAKNVPQNTFSTAVNIMKTAISALRKMFEKPDNGGRSGTEHNKIVPILLTKKNVRRKIV